MKVSDALQGLNRLFLDSSPVIYYIDAAQLKRVIDLRVLVISELNS